ncbi:MAG: serine hydrolase [Verrucomicrobia bacterium]|nr:serine hydrolase [Verrucomicrobiota bacterium]
MKLVRVNVRLPGLTARIVTSSLKPVFQAYHGVSNAEHQVQIDRWSAQGYRMISLSIYGDPDRPLYAAVWVHRVGSPWQEIHGVDAAGYQAFFDKWTARGYVPVLLSATGSSSNAVFAAVFERGIKGPWLARYGMSTGPAGNAGTFANENGNAAAQRMILRSVAVYGNRDDRRYAAVWHENLLYVKWHVHSSNSASNYQMAFDAETKLPGYDLAAYRPAYVAVSGDLSYCSLFKDDVVGPWVTRHGMTGREYQAELEHQVANEFYPICVQGGGSTANPVYAAIFATRDATLSREWTVAGGPVSNLAELDQIMQRFMQANGVRAAQLAVVKHGSTIFSRAYTWAEPGYRITELFTRFLIAGCSKIFLQAAVQSLYDDNKLKPTTAVYPLLGFSDPLDPRSDTITIQQLLDNKAGYDEGAGFDPTYNMRLIALELGLTHPVTKLDVARYMYGRMLDFTPGSDQKDSNYGYLLAGAVVEDITGNSYIDYINERLLTPAGLSEVKVISTSPSERTSDDAIAEDEGLGLSPIELRSLSLAPCVYGGNGQVNEVGDTNYGIGATAQTLARFIYRHAVCGNGPRASGCSRSEDGAGASCLASSRTDGVDWACTINTRNWPPSTSFTLAGLQNSIDELLDRLTIS